MKKKKKLSTFPFPDGLFLEVFFIIWGWKRETFLRLLRARFPFFRGNTALDIQTLLSFFPNTRKKK